MKKKLFSIPISNFSIDDTQDDLIPVRIQVCHDKENPNGSYFETNSFTKAQDSIKNKPIVAAYEINEDGEKEDFKGHEIEYKIVKEDGSTVIKSIYIEQPIGAIPETCDYSIEEIDGYNWICVNGYLYNVYCKDAVDILRNNDGSKNISMEIEVIDGEDNEDGYYHIKDFKFLGITVLGDPEMYPPAMGENANISLFTEQTKDFTMKFTKILDEINRIGGENMGESKKDFSLSSGDLRNRISEQLNEFTYEYTYSWGGVETYRQYFLVDVLPEENIVIVEDGQDDYKTYGISYTLEGDKVVLDMETKERYIRGDWRKFEDGQEEVEPLNEHQNEIFSKEIEHFKQEIEDVKASFVATETEEYKELKAQFEQLENEKKELEEFKADFEMKERARQENELFEKFKDLETVEGFAELKEKAKEFTLENLEKECFALLGKKNFSMNKVVEKENESTSLKVEDNSERELSEAEKRYGQL